MLVAVQGGIDEQKKQEATMDLVKELKQEISFWETRQQEACPLCGGTGFRLLERNGQIRARKCRCISLERIKTLHLKSGIPPIYWKESLKRIQPKSLQEICLVDFLKDFLYQQDLQALHLWIVFSERSQHRILSAFANDLIQMHGYSCLWIHCPRLGKSAASFKLQKKGPGTNPRGLEDFVFIENYQPGLLRPKHKQWLEATLWERIRSDKSILLVGPRPSGLDRELFSDRELTTAVLKNFKMIEPGKSPAYCQSSRWLF
jgi:hypothetical protein